jgi:hypothetical protein
VIKVIAKINSYQQLLHYREHKELNKRIPEYAIKMGFGLHMGWAIEGLIGSSHKVDASYLSPHVNLASRLEAATKQYGVSFLMSENIYNMLSYSFKKKCRCVDRCTLKGVANPMFLFTLEVETSNLPKIKDKYMKMSVKERQKIVNSEKNLLLEKLSKGEIETQDLLESNSAILHLDDKEMRRMLHFHNYASRKPFITSYRKAFKYYLKGDWSKSRDYFNKCLMMDGNDGPCKVLLEVLKETNYDSRTLNWKGYRILTDK